MQCLNCQASYIGQTVKGSDIKFKEHKKIYKSVFSRQCLDHNHKISETEGELYNCPLYLNRSSKDKNSDFVTQIMSVTMVTHTQNHLPENGRRVR